jgi:RNA polymerase sigma factor (sigma-70 family)
MSDKDGNLIIRPEWPAEQGAWLQKNVDDEALRLFAIRIVGDPQLAHDVVEECLNYMAAKPMEELEKVKHPRNYIQAAIKNRVINWRISQARFGAWPDGFDPPAATLSPEMQVDSEEEALELLAMLPERAAAALILCKIYGYTSEEAARKLRISESLVRKRVAAAIKFLNPDGRARDRRSITARISSIFKRKESKHDE